MSPGRKNDGIVVDPRSLFCIDLHALFTAAAVAVQGVSSVVVVVVYFKGQ